MESYFIALIPDDKTNSVISEAKKSIFQTFGPQKFLADSPHCTLYVSQAENLFDVENILRISLQDQKQILVNVTDWQIFPEDKLAGGGTTFGLKFRSEDKPQIVHLQKRLVNQLNALRNNHVHSRYQIDLPDSLMQSTEKYGYPFISSNTVENILLPHISFCSFNNPNNVEVFQQSNPITKFQGPITFTKLALFKLHDNDKTGLIRDFPLQ